MRGRVAAMPMAHAVHCSLKVFVTFIYGSHLSIASVSKSNALSPNWQLCEPAHPACRNWGDQNQFFVPRVGNWLEVFAAK